MKSFILSIAFGLGCVFATPVFAATTPKKTVTTVKKILAERKLTVKDKKKPRYCQTRPFKPCVCASDVTKLVQYRPAVRECRGKAAVILSGRYLNAFSAVVRDRENKDRWPPEGINGCSAEERDAVNPPNRCSAFKAQSVETYTHKDGSARVHCLGASGYSSLFKRVARITIKLADSPDSSNDPIARLCLDGPTKALN